MMIITLLAWCLESWEYSQFSPFKHEPWTKNLQSILLDKKKNKKIESLGFASRNRAAPWKAINQKSQTLYSQ